MCQKQCIYKVANFPWITSTILCNWVLDYDVDLSRKISAATKTIEVHRVCLDVFIVISNSRHTIHGLVLVFGTHPFCLHKHLLANYWSVAVLWESWEMISHWIYHTQNAELFELIADQLIWDFVVFACAQHWTSLNSPNIPGANSTIQSDVIASNKLNSIFSKRHIVNAHFRYKPTSMRAVMMW